MNSTLIARRLVLATAGVLAASAFFFPQLRPAQAAKKPKPFKIQGTYNGTYLSQDTTLSGPLKIVISSAKKLIPSDSRLFVQGKITLGTKTKNQKCQGFYNPVEKSLAINAPVENGYAVTFNGDLAADQKTFNGTFSYTHFPVQDEQVIGTATVAKK